MVYHLREESDEYMENLTKIISEPNYALIWNKIYMHKSLEPPPHLHNIFDPLSPPKIGRGRQ